MSATQVVGATAPGWAPPIALYTRRGASRPRLLDLFCCAGGASTGYARAGFDVEGVDHAPQPNYPFPFHQADAIEYLLVHGTEFDAVHLSPPCQGYTTMSNKHPDARSRTPQLIAAA